jgi:hypothetical protein
MLAFKGNIKLKKIKIFNLFGRFDWSSESPLIPPLLVLLLSLLLCNLSECQRYISTSWFFSESQRLESQAWYFVL